MREIRTSGSEGGGTGYSTGPPYPYMAVSPTGPKKQNPAGAGFSQTGGEGRDQPLFAGASAGSACLISIGS